MKKLFYLASLCCLALTSCEDVPAPYEMFVQKSEETTEDVASGTGTVTDPYNVAMVTQILDNGEETSSNVYIKGIICKVPSIDTSYGNAIYYISDDGNSSSTTFEIYRGYSLGGKKFTKDDEIVLGDTVVVYGVLTNYNGTYETTSGSSIYSINGSTSGSSDTPSAPTEGAGSRNEPYNVASAQQATGTAWVEGYIVGYVDGNAYESGAKFAVPNEAQTEVLLADAADVTDASKCMPIQLPVGAIRSALELYANPSMYKQKVQLYGSIETYFGTTGMKSTSCAIYGDKVIGTDPDNPTPAGDPQGDGTASNPYNVAAILQYTSSLAADTNSDKELYFKGIVSSTTDISTTYNNATFYISDDGSSANEFYVFRCLGVNKGDITSSDMIKAGDVVVMCGKVVIYKGNTPETVQKEAYIVSINGSSDSGEQGGDDSGSTEPASEITVAQFLANADTNTTYRLRGVVTGSINTTYGNFDLEQNGSTIYIYGLVDASGSNCYTSKGVQSGDSIVVEGK